MANIVILGTQWGDEGKGKIVDVVADRFDIVARSQGGHNAGHTVWVGDQKYILTLIPSGILHEKLTAIIGNGVVIEPGHLVREIETLRGIGVNIGSNLMISDRAHVIFPYHRMMERATEAKAGKVAIGTTSRGIGPTYEDKIARRGFRMADLLDREAFEPKFRALAKEKNCIAEALGIHEPWDIDEIYAEYCGYADVLRPYVTDTATYLAQQLAAGKTALFEGAQGTLLDIDHGTYPFVTSSNATAGGVCTGLGVPPTRIDAIFGVTKAYVTRVGSGAFPTEEHGPAGDVLRDNGHEFGTVTGRPRRCGWFDAPLMRYSSAVNGFDSMVVTKLDVMDHLDTIRVCVAYERDGERMESIPSLAHELESIIPVYEELPGWRSDTKGLRRYEELPDKARAYLDYLQEQSGVEVGAISTGPERDEIIFRKGTKLAAMLPA